MGRTHGDPGHHRPAQKTFGAETGWLQALSFHRHTLPEPLLGTGTMGAGEIRLETCPYRADKWRRQTCDPGAALEKQTDGGFQRRCPTQARVMVIKEGFLEEVAAEVWDGIGRVAREKAGGPMACCAFGNHTQPGHTFSNCWAFVLAVPSPKMTFRCGLQNALALSHPLHLRSEGPSYTPASHPQHHLSFCLPGTCQGLSCIMIH